MKNLLIHAALAGAGLLCAQQPPAPHPLTIEEAERQALQIHPALQAAHLRADSAAERIVQSKAAWLPTVTSSLTGATALEDSRIGAGSLSNSQVLDRVGMGASVSQLVYDFGRTSSLVQEARLRTEALRQTADVTKATVVLNVDQSFLRLLQARRILRVAEQTVQARQLVVDQVSALARSKLKSELDVTFAKVNLSEAQLLLASAKNDVAAASARLTNAMGLRQQVGEDVADVPLPGDLQSDLDSLLDQAMAKRPELKALALEEQALRKRAQAERASLFPTVSSVATAGYIPARQDPLSSRWAAAGVNVNVPVFNGKLFSSRRKEAELQADEVSARRKETENVLIERVRRAYLNARTALDRLVLTRELLQQAHQSLELAQARYDLGLGSIVELSQAQLNSTSAELANASARYEYQICRVVLRFETGDLL